MKYLLRSLLAFLLLVGAGIAAYAAPVIFWASDSLQPGDAVLLFGGGLAGVHDVRVRVLANDNALPSAQQVFASDRAITQPALQNDEHSLKFILPENFAAGMYTAQLSGGGAPVVLNRPEVWFLQPEHLQPGFRESQTAPGSAVQIIGKDFLLPGDAGKPRIILRPPVQMAGGRLRPRRPRSFRCAQRSPAI